MAQRTSSTAQAAYRNTSLLGTDATLAAAMPDAYIALIPFRTVRAFFFGRSLTSGERTSLYNLINAFLLWI